jgi:superfamily II DNA or RNA helicase
MRTALQGCKQKYFSPRDDIAEQVLIPAVSNCEKFDCMSGYFSASFLRELAPGLSQYLVNSDAPLRLLVSNEISTQDQQALLDGITENSIAYDIVRSAFEDESNLEDALVRHSKECLAYLVSKDRLQIKVVIKKKGMFHIKQYHFFYDDDVAVLSGSANATGFGMAVNDEQLFLQRSWNSPEDLTTCEEDVKYFEELWVGRADSVTVELDTAFKKELFRNYQQVIGPPSSDDYYRALEADITKSERVSNSSFQIPSKLVWESGSFKHQGDAVRAWEQAGRLGILAMATGAGKTLTSLIAAKRLSDELPRLMILIAVPTRPLLKQWEQDVLAFGLRPYVAEAGSSLDHLKAIDRKFHSLDLDQSNVEVAIVTLNLLKNEKMKELISRNSENVLLIADEVHNLGTESFTSAPPSVKYRLGLSATPERQYDADGTDILFKYFGDVVFTFSLEEAIGVCLVPYEYHIHEVNLSPDEMEIYVDLSEKIRKAYVIEGGGTDSLSNPRIQRLLEQRARVLESAENKLQELKRLIEASGIENVRHTLIYCTDKDPDQLLGVNEILIELGIRFHQVTDEESSDRAKLGAILDQFQKGNIKVLTAKRILDEGFNIPQIAVAYILASNTVERQWTQRRGRVLRKCDEIKKDHAIIHDFIAVPPENLEGDPDAARIVERELKRANEFARICRNKNTMNDPYIIIRELENRFLIFMQGHHQ